MITFALPHILLIAVLRAPAWAADTGSATSFVQVAFQAQALLTAISLSIVVFIVGAVQRREEVDDPLYAWFVREAWVGQVFLGMMGLLVATGIAYACAHVWPGDSGNLAIFAGLSSIVSILILLTFAVRALRVLRPSRYRDLKREVTVQQVETAVRSYLEYIRRASDDDLRSRNWRTPEGDAADRAIERIVDDAERAIRDARFADYRDSLRTLQEAVDAAIALGSPDIESLPWLVDERNLRDWPLRRPLRHGLARLSATALRERRDDYGSLIFDMRQEWLKRALDQDHALLIDLACVSLANEYTIACEYAGDRSEDRVMIGRRVTRTMFRFLTSLIHEDQWELSLMRRHSVSANIIELAHACAGEMIIRGDDDALGMWFELARNYMAQMGWKDTDAHKIGTSEPDRAPSLLTLMRLTVAALGGRTIALQAEPARRRLEDEMAYGAPPAFPGDEIAGEFARVDRASTELDRTWKRWLAQDTAARMSPLKKANRYPLMYYLWLGSTDEWVRAHVPNSSLVVSAMRRLWNEEGNRIIELAYDSEPVRAKRGLEVARWLGIGAGGNRSQ